MQAGKLWVKIMSAKNLKEYVHKRNSDSYTWKGLMWTRDATEKGIYRKVGDRSTIDIWTDPWISRLPLQKFSVFTS